MIKKILLTITFLIALVLLSTIASAHSCMISPSINHPLMPDTDCDGIIDPLDNCPLITNPLQRDSEMNGLGDACDLMIESINTAPADFVYNARAFNTYVTLYNNRDYNIRNLKIRITIPELGIESVQYIDNLKVCDAYTVEFFLRAPTCAPLNDYKIIVEASFMNEFGIFEVIPGITSIRVIPDQYCEMVLRNNQAIGNTIIDVMEIQDVYKGSEAVFPIRISNREFNDKEYVFSITGTDGWGNARIEPSSLFIVPSESERMADVYIQANEDVAPGERVFVVSIQSDEEIQRFLLIANIKEPETPNMMFLWLFTLKTILIIGISLLIIIGLIIGLKKYFKNINKSTQTQYY